MDECIDKLYDVTASMTEEDADSTVGVVNSAELRLEAVWAKLRGQ